MPGVVDIAEGKNLVVEPPHLLVQSFNALWSDEVKAQGTTRVTWEIEPVGDSCRLTVVHDQLPEDANAELYGGWPMILSGLKTLLETGELLTTPGLADVHPGRSRGPTLLKKSFTARSARGCEPRPKPSARATGLGPLCGPEGSVTQAGGG